MAVAIPSRLILPSNITLIEQGIKCSPFGVSISNLEHTPISGGFSRRGTTLKFTQCTEPSRRSPPLVVASTVFRLFRALLPLAMLWVSKLIIDGVVAWITRHRGNLVGIWKLVAFSRKTFSSFSPWSRPLGRRRTPFPRRARSGRDSSSAHVGLAYSGCNRMVIQNIKFTLYHDEKLALIG